MLVSQVWPKSQETRSSIQKCVITASQIHTDIQKWLLLDQVSGLKIFLQILWDAFPVSFLWKVLTCVNNAEILWEKICFSDPVRLPAQQKKKKEKKKAGVEFHKWPFLSSLLLHSFNCPPSFQVGEEQRKVDNVCWHADHAEIPQNKGKNRCEIERAGHWHPGGKDQKHCSFFGQRQSCSKDKQRGQVNQENILQKQYSGNIISYLITFHLRGFIECIWNAARVHQHAALPTVAILTKTHSAAL